MSPLFKCDLYAKSLESLYDLMWKKYENREPTDHLSELSLNNDQKFNEIL